MVDRADVVVVGAGILGLAAAFELAQSGLAVVVLEAEDAGGRHSTGRSAAYFIPMYESDAFTEFAAASLPFLQQPPGGFSDRPLLGREGAVIATSLADTTQLEGEMARARELGVEVEALDGAEVARLVPIARAERITGAAFYRGAGEIDIGALVAGFADGARRFGARIELGRGWTGTLTTAGRVIGVSTTRGEISCGHVVNAAGAWCERVGRASGAAAIPFTVTRRHVIQLRLPDHLAGRTWPFFRCPSVPLWCKPTGAALLASPMDEEVDEPGDCRIEPGQIEAVTRSVRDYTTLLGEPERAWAGHRVFSGTKVPVVGPDPTLSGFHWAAGLGGAGIMGSPAVGQRVRDGILASR
ncbi:FAD-binding oxidoreductase [Enterovirga sp.]|uniref:NAD(P)/FAD-dependent oxidoreductase n=1 Tax=Enterovirga sp. TaxID=2026350 RepID=UPI00262C7ED5|nr:FAD-binding oxidoreductase [Enterovirga sp.]MDB5592885.1 glycine/D-amino acid oxidase (deaminating) protein [Enterovirga sp.]